MIARTCRAIIGTITGIGINGTDRCHQIS